MVLFFGCIHCIALVFNAHMSDTGMAPSTILNLIPMLLSISVHVIALEQLFPVQTALQHLEFDQTLLHCPGIFVEEAYKQADHFGDPCCVIKDDPDIGVGNLRFGHLYFMLQQRTYSFSHAESRGETSGIVQRSNKPWKPSRLAMAVTYLCAARTICARNCTHSRPSDVVTLDSTSAAILGMMEWNIRRWRFNKISNSSMSNRPWTAAI